jgi:hypothetical protein
MYEWGHQVMGTCTFSEEIIRDSDETNAMNIIGDTTWGIHIITRGTTRWGYIQWISVPSGTGTTLVLFRKRKGPSDAILMHSVIDPQHYGIDPQNYRSPDI